MILYLFAFLAGLVTILSPCILPILPIVLSGSLLTGKRRPLGVIVGFVTSFTFFAVFSFSLARTVGLSTDVLRNIAALLLVIFGLTVFVPRLQLMLEQVTSRFSSLGQGKKRTGFAGGFVMGVTLGLIWTPCVGPILASVITLAATSNITLELVLITFSYSLGTALPLFFIAYGGKRALHTLPVLKQNAQRIQKIFGVLILITALLIFFNLDRRFQTYILDVFPQYGQGLTSFEKNSKVDEALESLKKGESIMIPNSQDSANPAPNKNFEGATKWLQSKPLTLDDLKGKVVLVDFWTYTCINCIRTFPHVTSWYEKYKDDGFVVIGVHTPEFEFEKSEQNVLNAMKEYNISYPVVQDNEYKIWTSYSNRYWPAHYLIDKEGNIRHTHFGEGEYDKTEMMIQLLLNEAGSPVKDDLSDMQNTAPTSRVTPETYLGFARIERFASPEKIQRNIRTAYTIPSSLETDFFAFGGLWSIASEYAVSSKGSRIELAFNAQRVFLVMRPHDSSKPGTATVSHDGKKVAKLAVHTDKLYTLLELGAKTYGRVTIEFDDEPIQVFAFTFG